MSCLSHRRHRTARFFVWGRAVFLLKTWIRRTVAMAFFYLLPGVLTILLAGCTLLPAANTAEPTPALGEPTVAFAGEPEVARAPEPTSSPSADAGTVPVVDRPTAEPTSVAAPDTPTTDVLVSLSASTPAPVAAISLTALLQQPVETLPAAHGGISAAAGGAARANSTATALPAIEVTATLPASLAISADENSPAAESPEADESAPAEQATTALPDAQVTPDGIARTLHVPILMYHYLSVPPADADIYRKDLSVTPELFAAQLDRLLAEGFTTISFYAFLNALQTGASLPEKPVILSFDDGYRDNYENAFPALRERNMTATFFVVSDFIDQERPEYLTWDMAREMLAGGMSIESHGRNHASLEGRDDDYLVWQALGSMETIAYELGVRPRFVAYPAGEYDANTQRIFASAGYWAGVTTRQGATHSNENLLELNRIRVRGTTSPDELIRLLELDW